MKFEYDVFKSILNKQKHGISLERAQDLWRGPFVQSDTPHMNEIRFIIVGKLDNKFYSCVFTMRGETIRLISARRSRTNEEKVYYEHESRQENNSEAV